MKNKYTPQQPPQDSFLFYTDTDGKLHIEVFYADETVWLTQKRMGELFGVESNTITYHLGEVFESGELIEAATTRKFRVVQDEGGRDVARNLTFYNLDAIISVGYRVNSTQATKFRIWATSTLRDFMIRGFVIDKDRLKNGTHFGKDYFDDLVEQVREIRASERRVHMKLVDIFELSSDYDSRSGITKQFFAFVQNKLHYAITGETAAEIRYHRADADKDHMGLTSWKAGIGKKIVKSDVLVAKNYLSKDELQNLERAVVTFLDIAETRARRGTLTTMKDWLGIMDGYLDLNDFPKLEGAGKISKDVADKKTIGQYEKFRIIQDRQYANDLELSMKKLESGEVDKNEN